MPRSTTGADRWLRVEGLTVLILAVCLYRHGAEPWLWFAVLFFMPDISIAGYWGGPRVGAICYNALHTYTFPLLFAAIHLATGRSLALPLIWIAHIGFDRTLGYGLKFPGGFKETHLGRIGRRSR